MDQLSVVFQISVFMLCCMSSAMLLSADTPFPYLLTIPFAIVALVVTEFKKSFHLSTAWSNLFGTLALGYAVVRMFPLFIYLMQGNELNEDRTVFPEIVVAGHLLVFLTWIVFFMPKRPREYWAMCTLSVLQVAIGAILSSSGTYGILLIGYVLLGIWTLSIFSIEQTRWQVAETERSGDWLQPAAVDRKQVKVRGRQIGNSLEGYWKRPSQSTSTIQIDPRERWISTRFIFGMLGTAAVSILISGLFVVFTPRIWAGPGQIFGQVATEAAAVTGFTESVKLGGESRIGESSRQVMEVKLFDADTGQRVEVADYAAKLGYEEPLFRGSILETYEDAGWTTRLTKGREFDVTPRTRLPLIRQEITLQPTGAGVLLTMSPAVAGRIDESQHSIFQNDAGTLLRFRTNPNEFSRVSSMSGFSQEVAGIPWTAPLNLTVFTREELRWAGLSEHGRDIYLQFPTRGLDRLRTLARDVAQQSRQSGATSDEQVARAMEKYFVGRGEFIYTLELERRDLSLDPLEDFLFNTRAGHCEYYASALAMMLRAAGIPSRLISGFKGGDVGLTNEFVVRQLHAHAWVEAYVDRQWVTLDPTPARETRRYGAIESSIMTWQDFKTLVEGFWSTYVTHADLTKQRQRIYEPIAKRVREWWESTSEQRNQWSEKAFDLWSKARTPRNWFSWQGALISSGLCLFVALLAWGFKGFLSRLRRLFLYLFQPRSSKRSAIAFYERFRKICRARGFERRPSQTQREFVAEVHRSLSELLASAGLAAFPRHLVDGFYQVRFGGIPLDDQTADLIDRNLTALEQTLKHQQLR